MPVRKVKQPRDIEEQQGNPEDVLTEEQEAPADGIVKTLRSGFELTGDGSGEPLPPIADEPLVIAESIHGPFRVIALQAFGDVKPPHSYIPGDEVHGWDLERAAKYAARGLVEIVQDGISEQLPDNRRSESLVARELAAGAAERG